MTVRDVTKPLSWDVTAQFSFGAVTGHAETRFTFGEFEMRIPRVALVLSVDDEIRLELDFTASIETGG